MRMEFVSKNYKESDKLKAIIDQKLAKLDKYFYDDAVAHVTLAAIGESGDKLRMEITIKFGGRILRAETISDNMYNNIDELVPKLDRQIRKNRTRLASKIREVVEPSAEEKSATVVRTKKFEVSEMSVDDAIAELELTGHNFYIFLDNETNKIKVVYLRKDGSYGLLEPKY